MPISRLPIETPLCEFTDVIPPFFRGVRDPLCQAAAKLMFSSAFDLALIRQQMTETEQAGADTIGSTGPCGYGFEHFVDRAPGQWKWQY